MIPAFMLDNYARCFDGCLVQLPDLCTTFRTYLSTLNFCLVVWAITLVIGFTVAYFLPSIPLGTMQLALSLLCTIPFWTSNVIRMISWVPLLGRNGLSTRALAGVGIGDPALRLAPVFQLLGARSPSCISTRCS